MRGLHPLDFSSKLLLIESKENNLECFFLIFFIFGYIGWMVQRHLGSKTYILRSEMPLPLSYSMVRRTPHIVMHKVNVWHSMHTYSRLKQQSILMNRKTYHTKTFWFYFFRRIQTYLVPLMYLRIQEIHKKGRRLNSKNFKDNLWPFRLLEFWNSIKEIWYFVNARKQAITLCP